MCSITSRQLAWLWWSQDVIERWPTQIRTREVNIEAKRPNHIVTIFKTALKKKNVSERYLRWSFNRNVFQNTDRQNHRVSPRVSTSGIAGRSGKGWGWKIVSPPPHNTYTPSPRGCCVIISLWLPPTEGQPLPKRLLPDWDSFPWNGEDYNKSDRLLHWHSHFIGTVTFHWQSLRLMLSDVH